MDNTSENRLKKHICAGILAHVDAGKTTLSEALLYLSGSIRKMGRVDYGDAFLDTYEMERARGITIFSKQARFSLGETEVTLLDTPGHVDFSAEMERTLQVLDYAVLVISGADGVQGHTLTLWKLLSRYQIPVFLFVNKMDQEGTDSARLLAQLQSRLDERCIDFSASAALCLGEGSAGNGSPGNSYGVVQKGKEAGMEGGRASEEELLAFMENIAVCDEQILEQYLDQGQVETEEIRKLIAERKVFPCYFGSALKLTGVEAFLNGFSFFTEGRSYPEQFAAKVFKVSRDDQGNRLTHMKITGGILKVKDILSGNDSGRKVRLDDQEPAEEISSFWEEKVNQIRLYSGAKYDAVNEAGAGTICAVTGLTRTYAGQGLGAEEASDMPVLEPVLSYRIELPEECDVHTMLAKLRLLEEEEPLLHILWNEQLNEIHAQLMGEVQIDVLKNLVKERFGVEIGFGAGHIVYKETIGEPVEGVGHFEPLRHYAEVHLLLEPGERGSGLQFGACCSEDVLDKNWQRLVLTHLEEREHKGVLTGSPITDMKISVIAGRAHQKHTEGGDFRQATYRAVRQGLMKARSILLEPYYEFKLELPADLVGRAMADIQKMSGTFEGPQIQEETAVLTGSAPVVEMRGYPVQVAAYSRGLGRLFCTMKGYEPCHNEDEVLAAFRYEPELDLANTADSVFCSHGAGFIVPWHQVEDYMHVDSGLKLGITEEPEPGTVDNMPGENDYGSLSGRFSGLAGPGRASDSRSKTDYHGYSGSLSDDKELEEIFRRTYGDSKRQRLLSEQRAPGGRISGRQTLKERVWQRPEPAEEYLLVDGYNIIFSWDELKELGKVNMDGARHRLMDILCNYQGFKKCHLILVFDAYKVEGHACEVQKYHNIHVVYTKEAETADQYIEKTVHELGKKYHVTVATSDGLEQVIILGQGGLRMSAAELKDEVERTNQTIREEYLDKPRRKQNLLFQDLDEETAAKLEEIRRRDEE
ncbi:MAG: TetM/TetW/TetO/TetS family tetracycline resistance ribosomal protection protein [Lachnospiraceae bacterium]|nr:TetM/TetW/TetO/TetS family tetracycline resistance ribosomal protection protein [Lachnospiraceae bacterium]